MNADIKPGQAPYGFVKKQGRDLVPVLVDKYSQTDFNKKILVPSHLEGRLNRLANGDRVLVPVINCIDFDWQPSVGEYPKSTILPSTDTSIAAYFKPKTEEVLLDLQAIGKAEAFVIVPDSEIFDTRVFSFKQSLEERKTIATQIEAGLAEKIGELPGSANPVTRWSRYCEVSGLALPEEYTTRATEKIKGNPKLTKKVADQIKDSKRYLMQHGIAESDIADIPPTEIAERISWYLAMYTGEGITLGEQEDKVLMLNFEDGRVPAWYQRGADDKLAIMTPGNPNEFYSWRREVKAGNINPDKIS